MKIRELRLSAEHLVWLAVSMAVLLVVLWPLAISIDAAFHQETRFGLSPNYGWTAIIDVYTTSGYLDALLQTVRLSAWVTALCTITGVLIAVLMARTDLPGKGVLEILVVMPLFIAPFTGLIAWVAIGSAKTGFFNTIVGGWLQSIGIEIGPLIDVWSYGGTVWVMFLFFTPFVYLFSIGSMRSMDGSLEEAARSVGASAFKTITRITIPLSMPSILIAVLVVFILTAETYTIPGIIGSFVGFDVLAYKIFEDATAAPIRQAHAAAAATMLLLVACFGMVLQRHITRSASRFVTVTGKGFRAKPLALGKWKPLAMAVILVYAFFATILPLCALLLSSLMRFSSGDVMGQALTLANYYQFFGAPDMRQALMNTVFLAVLAGGLCVFAGGVISFMDVRRPGRATRVVALLSSIPVAVPGLVFGIGFLTVVLKTPMYGTIWVLLLVYVAKYVPFGVMMTRGGLQQLHPDLESAARMSGASPMRTVWAITLPLMRLTLLSALFCVMMLCFKELSASVMLYTKNSEVLSVLTWHYMDSGNYQFAATLGVLQSLIIITMVVLTRVIFGIKLERAMGK